MPQITDAVLITGGSRRLGLEFARKTLDMGFSVIIHYRNDYTDTLKTLGERFESRIFFLQHDLLQSPELLIDKALDLPVNPAGLVNNASIFTEGNLCDMENFDRITRINALVPARLCTSFFNKIKKGWVINITDAIIDKVNSRFQNYRISKLLLQELTRQQAYLFAPDLRVNALAPGAMIPASFEDQRYFDSLAGTIPMHTTGDLTSLMNAYEFLVKSPYVTGETIRVDGGWNIVS